eukprot:3248906-Alexandrium_andersonii.AAC.1
MALATRRPRIRDFAGARMGCAGLCRLGALSISLLGSAVPWQAQFSPYRGPNCLLLLGLFRGAREPVSYTHLTLPTICSV